MAPEEGQQKRSRIHIFAQTAYKLLSPFFLKAILPCFPIFPSFNVAELISHNKVWEQWSQFPWINSGLRAACV